MREKIQSPIDRRAFLKGSGGCLLAAGAGNSSPLLGRSQAAQRLEDHKVLFVCVDGDSERLHAALL